MSVSALYSTRDDDPDVEERIDDFVVGLGERIDHLQDAETAGDPGRLRDLAKDLAAEAETLGYPPMAAAARRVGEACDGTSEDLARKAVREVTELAKRIRRGHRTCA